MQEEIKDFSQDIITLHNIARKIEREIGQGQLSEDLRKVADRLAHVVKPYDKEQLAYTYARAMAGESIDV